MCLASTWAVVSTTWWVVENKNCNLRVKLRSLRRILYDVGGLLNRSPLFSRVYRCLNQLPKLGGTKMNKTYQEIIKILGVVAFSMLLVAVLLHLNGKKTNAEIALGACASISGIALIMYSLRQWTTAQTATKKVSILRWACARGWVHRMVLKIHWV